jgi:hypothetical protein
MNDTDFMTFLTQSKSDIFGQLLAIVNILFLFILRIHQLKFIVDIVLNTGLIKNELIPKISEVIFTEIVPLVDREMTFGSKQRIEADSESVLN